MTCMYASENWVIQAYGGIVMAFELPDLRELATFGDDVGVVSLYTTMEPGTTAWQVRARNEIAALRRDLARHVDKDLAKLVLARLDVLEPRIDQLLNPTEPGLGRALFAQVAGDEVRTLWVQLPVGDLAVLEPNAYLRPWVTAVEEGAPAGVVMVGRDGVRLVDCRYGLAEELEPIGFDLDTEDWRRKRGPATPGLSRRAVDQHDRFEQRIDEHLIRFLRTVAPRVAEQAEGNDWQAVLLAGDPRATDVLGEAMPMGRDTVLLDAIIDPALSPAEVLAYVRPTFTEVRTRRDAALVERARELALSGGNGVLGLGDTLAMLRAGRVEHLLLDAAGEWKAATAVDAGAAPIAAELVEEGTTDDLGERMIELALEHATKVTMLGPEAAAGLAQEGGVAALLRW